MKLSVTFAVSVIKYDFEPLGETRSIIPVGHCMKVLVVLEPAVADILEPFAGINDLEKLPLIPLEIDDHSTYNGKYTVWGIEKRDDKFVFDIHRETD